MTHLLERVSCDQHFPGHAAQFSRSGLVCNNLSAKPLRARSSTRAARRRPNQIGRVFLIDAAQKMTEGINAPTTRPICKPGQAMKSYVPPESFHWFFPLAYLRRHFFRMFVPGS